MKAIFFDLDGTLLDTARDFAHSINLLLAQQNKPAIDFNLFRQEVHGESKRMISYAFNIIETHPDFNAIREAFLKTYHQNCTQKTVYFPGMELLLNKLDEKKIPWGIVTNKPTWLTTPIIQYFELDKRAVCIVSGDTVSQSKPHPAPLHFACKSANISPNQGVYVGDNETDIIAAKAAGMKSIGVTFGYHAPKTDFATWNADLIVHSGQDILPWVSRLIAQS